MVVNCSLFSFRVGDRRRILICDLGGTSGQEDGIGIPVGVESVGHN